MTARKQYEVTVYGARGTGPTQAAAKARAIKRIEAAFTEPYAGATLQRFPLGEVGFTGRDLEGWYYMALWPNSTSTQCQSGTGYLRQTDAEQALRRHIAQGYWDHAPSDYGCDLLGSTDTEGRQEQRRYRTFQLAHRAAVAQGMAPVSREAHRWACDHQRDFATA